MTGGGSGTGSDGSAWDGNAKLYPGVPYGPGDFHGAADCPTGSGDIENYGDPIQVWKISRNDIHFKRYH